MPRFLTVSKFRENLAGELDQLSDDHDPICLERHGHEYIIVPKEDYEEMDETAYLLSTKANRERLAQAVKEAQHAKGKRFKNASEMRKALGI